MKTVVLDGYTLNPGDITWEGFKKFKDVTIYDRTPFSLSNMETVIERAKDAEAIFINKIPVSKEIIDRLPKLKFIGVLATGYNIIDVNYAKEKGIVVTNVPTYGTEIVAQMVFAHLLNICQHVSEHSKAVKKGEWTNNRDWCFWKFPLIELLGKTMGIIGYGRIGKATSKIAQALGMKVIAFSRREDKTLENENMKYVSLDELLKKSDVISLHCPLFENTRGMINKDTIEKMKDGVIIINTSRGPLIVEKDLVNALNSGKVYAAGLDTTEVEPIGGDSPLLKCENAIITPHIAWAAKESRQRLMDIAAGNLENFIKGNPVNVVNK